MSEICEPKRIISAAILSRRLAISRPALAKHIRRQLITPDYQSDCGILLLCTTGKDLLGHDFGAQTVDQIPIVPSETYAALSDVADDGFWAPFAP